MVQLYTYKKVNELGKFILDKIIEPIKSQPKCLLIYSMPTVLLE